MTTPRAWKLASWGGFSNPAPDHIVFISQLVSRDHFFAILNCPFSSVIALSPLSSMW